ncbi:TIGR04282 family arsenosugar biosynthesis glycosyltransferase [uncultured Croceitalea sp.]|uniref:TIGR04282 family arsenosugar biosynthesis glycosyltransferase n=1 Tax=uncultured Croceitalea sp. TaxID=1798908 RepID=UPI003306610A
MQKKSTQPNQNQLKKTSNNLLLIFTRNPELGKCKTRLAATVGDKAALDIYKFLLRHTVSITENLDFDKRVYYSEEVWEDDVWNSKIFEKRLQKGIDLGERMHNAFKDGFIAGYKNICIIGSDMFDLTQYDIENAFKQLDNHNFVVGPAEDGGYYLLGMNALNEKLFRDKAWGTGNVLKHTLVDLKEENYSSLALRNDVDLYEDISAIDAFQPFLKHLKK